MENKDKMNGFKEGEKKRFTFIDRNGITRNVKTGDVSRKSKFKNKKLLTPKTAKFKNDSNIRKKKSLKKNSPLLMALSKNPMGKIKAAEEAKSKTDVESNTYIRKKKTQLSKRQKVKNSKVTPSSLSNKKIATKTTESIQTLGKPIAFQDEKDEDNSANDTKSSFEMAIEKSRNVGRDNFFVSDTKAQTSKLGVKNVSTYRFAGAKSSAAVVDSTAVKSLATKSTKASPLQKILISIKSSASIAVNNPITWLIGGGIAFFVLLVVLFTFLVGGATADSSSGDEGSLSGVALQVYKAIKKEEKEATNEGIASILGNFKQESNLDPSSINPIGAQGLGQWYAERASALQAYAKEKGKPWDNVELQIDFMFNRDSGKEIARRVAKSKDVTDGTSVFFHEWERAGDDTLPKRITYAKEFLKQMSSSGGSTGKIPPQGLPDNPYPQFNYINPDGTGNASGSCTSFVWAYFKVNLNFTIPTYAGNAGAWVAYANSSLAKNTIAVFPPFVGGAGELGHVAVVTKVNSDGTFDVIEGGWNGNDPKGWGHVRTGISAKSVSFINPKK
ncbi:phage tail tip lysozyme [Lactococcus garvieae]|uniref:phage tail tip lysozyme n=1 Tax=Lactococcus garvieae TaxID=1363 RepID=UPI00254DE463|nr:phage tail tip lysozyme [Lactococcus garvieae]